MPMYGIVDISPFLGKPNFQHESWPLGHWVDIQEMLQESLFLSP